MDGKLMDRDELIIAGFNDGKPVKQLAEDFGISRQTVYNVINKHTGEAMRRKRYDDYLPSTMTVHRQRVFVDALAQVRNVDVSTIMRSAVDVLEQSITDTERKQVMELLDK